MKELLYNGKPMDPTPTAGTIQGFASDLVDGETVLVQLEPGDATHYALLIAPCWAHPSLVYGLGRLGIPARSVGEYLFVAKVGDQESIGNFVHNRLPVLPFDVEPLSKNGWSWEFLSWWLTQLWEAINGIQASDPRFAKTVDAAVERPARLG